MPPGAETIPGDIEIRRIEHSGGYMMTIYAPPGARPHSLGGLSRFLEEKNCFLLPGYADNPGEPVLRVGLYPDVPTLMRWLKEELPLWQAEHGAPRELNITVPPEVEAVPLMPREHSTVQPTNFINRLRLRYGHKTGPMAGASFNVGNIMMLASALTSKGDGSVDVSRVFSAVIYIMSSAVVMVNSGQVETQRPLQDIVQEVVDGLEDEHIKRLVRENRPLIDPFVEHLGHAMRDYPWEVKAVMDAVAGGGMFVGGLMSGNMLTAASAALGMASVVTQMTPPRYRDSLIDPQWARDFLDNTGIRAFVREQREQKPWLGRIIQAARDGIHWMQENSLLVSGVLGALSSVGYVLAGLFGRKDKTVDTGLTASGLALVAGNVLKAFSIQKSSYNIGDMGFATAHALQRQQGGDADPAAPDHEMRRFMAAEALTQAHEVNHSRSNLERQMQQMMEVMKLEGDLTLQRPDEYIKRMNWSELRQTQFLSNPFVPMTAALEDTCKERGLSCGL